MTYEEAIILLRCEATNLVGFGASEQDEKKAQLIFDKVDAIDVAIEALERQTPKKPIPYRIKSNPFCSKCGRVISAVEYARKIDYCCDCGQAIDWSE